MTCRSYSWGRIFAAALVVVLLVVAMRLPRNQHEGPLRVAVGIWPGSESLVLARAMGLLPADRFQLMEVTWASAAYRAFDNGVVDAVVLSLDGVLRLLESGEALRVIYVMDVSKGADAILVRDEGETTVLDLKGRRVGVDVRGSGMYLLAAALAPAGLTITDVEIVPLLQPEMEAAFLLGDVNAVVVSEPWMTELRAKGARVLMDSNAVSPPIYRVLAVTESALQERGDELVELLSAHLAMVPRLQVGGDEKEMNAILRREGLTRGKFTAALGRVHHLDVMENRSLLGEQGAGIANIVSKLDERMDGSENRAHAPLVEDWIDASILEAAGP